MGEERYANMRCALSIVSRDLAIIARKLINQDPEMIRKSLGSAVYEPATRTLVRCGFTNTQINSGFIVPTDGDDWLIISAAKRVCARDEYTYTRTRKHTTRAQRLNIPDAYRDNNSVATVALFNRPQHDIYRQNTNTGRVFMLLRELEESWVHA